MFYNIRYLFLRFRIRLRLSGMTSSGRNDERLYVSYRNFTDVKYPVSFCGFRNDGERRKRFRIRLRLSGMTSSRWNDERLYVSYRNFTDVKYPVSFCGFHNDGVWRERFRIRLCLSGMTCSRRKRFRNDSVMRGRNIIAKG